MMSIIHHGSDAVKLAAKRAIRTSADETIHAVNASEEEAARLRVRLGSARFRIIATGLTSGERPLWHEDTLYLADVYEFRNRIGGLSGPHAVVGKIRG
jgi:DNA-binding GntR family transcriptional regulator